MIEFKGVYKTYDNGTKALRDINLTINDGEFVFIVGSSGAGKSTFLKLMMHEETPNAGEVIVNNYRLSTLKRKEVPYLRRTMGVVFQDFRLIPKMTVFDNVAFAMRVIGIREKEIRKRVPYILGLVGLTGKARSLPNELSGGEQQRVSLARALVNNPSMIIADEPTGNVDPEMSYEIVELLNGINQHGTTVVMVTHEHELVREFNRRVVLIENGRITSDTADDYDFAEKIVEGDSLVRSGNITTNADDFFTDTMLPYDEEDLQRAGLAAFDEEPEEEFVSLDSYTRRTRNDDEVDLYANVPVQQPHDAPPVKSGKSRKKRRQ